MPCDIYSAVAHWCELEGAALRRHMFITADVLQYSSLARLEPRDDFDVRKV